MRTYLQHFRIANGRLPDPASRRLVIITGARQTGKTTLARLRYPDLRYLNLDSAEERESLRDLRTAAWGRTVGPAVLDEAQKEPSVFEKVKWAFDAGEVPFTVLLGSSRLALMRRVRETLAGRAFLFELWPLCALELRHATDGARPPRPLAYDLATGAGPIDERLREEAPVLLGHDEDIRREAIEHLLAWGGMPALLPLSDADRRDWLRSYQQTFLERDLADLGRLDDLHAFRRLERLCMLRSGGLLSYADLARDAGIAPATARRYLGYLEASCQVIQLPPYSRNLTSTVVKAPKMYWMDMGLLRHGTHQFGAPDGALFETMVVAELRKWSSAAGVDAELFFYRTRSGLEVDLLLETPSGVIGLEIKHRPTAVRSDARGLLAVAEALGAHWRGGIVVTSGGQLEPLVQERSIWAVPIHRLV
jgi:predicted AAA+ superfamily ATPase